jgi:hypothetical protein
MEPRRVLKWGSWLAVNAGFKGLQFRAMAETANLARIGATGNLVLAVAIAARGYRAITHIIQLLEEAGHELLELILVTLSAGHALHGAMGKVGHRGEVGVAVGAGEALVGRAFQAVGSDRQRLRAGHALDRELGIGVAIQTRLLGPSRNGQAKE